MVEVLNIGLYYIISDLKSKLHFNEDTIKKLQQENISLQNNYGKATRN